MIDEFNKFMTDGGIFMWVILFIWLTGIALSLYKLIFLIKADCNANNLFNKVKNLILENQVEKAINICSNQRAVLPNVIQAGLKRAGEDRTLIEDALSNSLLEQTPQLSYHLNFISLIANSSTLVGLLGTIQGLILSFAAVGSSEVTNKSEALAEGIAKAMNTTAFGLISAITIMALHTYLNGKSNMIQDRVEEIAGKILDILSIKKKKSA